METKRPLLGFVGQGFVGKNYADDFENRGYRVVRYSLEQPYRKNKSKIAQCDVVFVAVPTPTTPDGFSHDIVSEALNLIGPGSIGVIKSTVVPGTTEHLQKKHPSITLLFSPEFLLESTAVHDAAHPFTNIVGVPSQSAQHKKAAETVLDLLAPAPSSHVCTSTEAELIKYAHNISGYMQILTFNLFYDLAKQLGASWDNIQPPLYSDPYIPNYYTRPLHKKGRGAGGSCFVKDFAAFTDVHSKLVEDPLATAFLRAAEIKNMQLLHESGKDLHILEQVYGSGYQEKHL